MQKIIKVYCFFAGQKRERSTLGSYRISTYKAYIKMPVKVDISSDNIVINTMQALP